MKNGYQATARGTVLGHSGPPGDKQGVILND